MVTRILSGKSIRGLLNYNENKVTSGDANLILANRFGVDIIDLELRDKLSRFQHLTTLNDRAKTNAIHIMLNFDRADSLSTEKLQTISIDYMQRIGFGEQPFLVYQHLDASHPHIHIVTTNIRENGDRISIHNIGRDLDEKIRRAMQSEYNLIKAEDRQKEIGIKMIDIQPAAYGKKPTRQSVYNVVTAVLREYKFTSLAEYNAVLGVFNVTADRGKADSIMYERRGLVYAVVGKDGKRIGVPIKACSFAGKPVLNKVEGKFAANELKKRNHAPALKGAIDKTFQAYQSLTRKTFVAELLKRNISVVFRQSDLGKIFGVTFVDHNTKSVFNGSDLGKAYSAKGLQEQFGVTDQLKQLIVTDAEVPLGKEGVLPAINMRQPNKQHEIGPMDLLLQKPEFEPIIRQGRNKRKKKKRKISSDNDLGSQIR